MPRLRRWLRLPPRPVRQRLPTTGPRRRLRAFSTACGFLSTGSRVRARLLAQASAATARTKSLFVTQFIDAREWVVVPSVPLSRNSFHQAEPCPAHRIFVVWSPSGVALTPHLAVCLGVHGVARASTLLSCSA